MDNKLLEELKQLIKGDITTSDEALNKYSHDASLFEVKPQVIVFPKDEEDVKALVKFVDERKNSHPSLSITGRSAGTDMSGGPINESIIVEFTKYFNHVPKLNGDIATTEPGVYYRDFEIETLRHNLIFPSYPASREICAMGGIVNNNSGGEKSLQYGKTENYVERIRVVLADGSIAELKKLTEKELLEKTKLKTFEGEIYRKTYKLILDNYAQLLSAKPDVSKNSAGYFLWNVYDKDDKTFDLTKLFVGAQGTLGLMINADIKLVPVKKHRAMLVLFLNDTFHLGQIVDEVMKFKPESFESYDDNTLKLALRYFPEFAKQLGPIGMIKAGLAFLPAFFSFFTGKSLPKLILQIDFTGDDIDELEEKVRSLKDRLKPFHPQSQIAKEGQEKKYWLVRRESFNLLRNKIRNKHTAPFIDDFVIKPEYIAEVLPQVTAILKKHPEFIFTVAGHVGNGNFHIIPIVDIKNPKVRAAIPQIADEVYKIIAKYNGSITGEHNDGIIRTPYLAEMYDDKIIKLFEQTKEIFDPKNIFNPGKKVGGTLKYAMDHIRQDW
ncbi:MAG: FAD-binding oxidoreductase [Candidatus Levybacteria bacterium CG10_big_fil_rev_8_21_14_0_10_36_7]|nr:MAG: FAD-binding oxidoreductase [Candidatus Levybacteria bacterium CG10_big_fil_rev_8_21_14_0_10_36_7]